MPRNFGFESRRFLAVPAAFLVAIVYSYRMSIADLSLKIKRFLVLAQRSFKERLEDRSLYFGAAVILVAAASFGLGRLSYMDGMRPPVLVTGGEVPVASVVSSVAEEGSVAVETSSKGASVIASKNGTKYYYENCKGASRISAANRMTFASAKEAERAGYALASGCRP